MKLEEAKKETTEIRKQLTALNLEACLDDGRDSGDARQNMSFTQVSKSINDIQTRLSFVDIDGVDTEELWLTAWHGRHNHIPEDRYTHAIAYCDSILKL